LIIAKKVCFSLITKKKKNQMSSINDKIQHFEKLSTQPQQQKKRTSSSGSSVNNKPVQPSTPKIDTNRLLQRLGSGRTGQVSAASPQISQSDSSIRAKRNPALLLSCSSPSSATRISLLKHTTKAAPSSSSSLSSTKLFHDSGKESAYQSMLDKMTLLDSKDHHHRREDSPPPHNNKIRGEEIVAPDHAAGLPSSTFSENKVVDVETNKILLLSSSSPMPDAAKRKRMAASQSPDPDHPSTLRKMKSSLFKSTKSQSPRLAAETNNMIPRWATPSPASAQKREGDDREVLDAYSPAEDLARGIGKKGAAENEEFKQHLFGEEPDPCPPEMLMEMVLRSVVFPQNEIKMKRQMALWECYERKMATGSFLDAPFASEYSG
jgi:hypothetical protein